MTEAEIICAQRVTDAKEKFPDWDGEEPKRGSALHRFLNPTHYPRPVPSSGGALEEKRFKSRNTKTNNKNDPPPSAPPLLGTEGKPAHRTHSPIRHNIGELYPALPPRRALRKTAADSWRRFYQARELRKLPWEKRVVVRNEKRSEPQRLARHPRLDDFEFCVAFLNRFDPLPPPQTETICGKEYVVGGYEDEREREAVELSRSIGAASFRGGGPFVRLLNAEERVYFDLVLERAACRRRGWRQNDKIMDKARRAETRGTKTDQHVVCSGFDSKCGNEIDHKDKGPVSTLCLECRAKKKAHQRKERDKAKIVAADVETLFSQTSRALAHKRHDHEALASGSRER